MNVLIFILLLLLVLIILIFAVAIRLTFILDTDKEDMKVTLIWLYPFIKLIVKMENARPLLIVCLFKKKVYERILKKKRRKRDNMELVRLAKTEDFNVTASYGFVDPATTGVTCAGINIISNLIGANINNRPNFMPQNNYVYLNANASVNVGQTLVNLIKAKFKGLK